MVNEKLLRVYHVADGNHRKIQPVRLSCFRVFAPRSRSPHAATQHISANDKIALCIQGLARSHHQIPPPHLTGDGVEFGHKLVAGERMTDKHGVGFLGVETAVGLIGHCERSQRRAAIKHQWSIAAELDAVAGKITGIYDRAFWTQIGIGRWCHRLNRQDVGKVPDKA